MLCVRLAMGWLLAFYKKHMDAMEIWMLWLGGLLRTSLLVTRQACIIHMVAAFRCIGNLPLCRMPLARFNPLFQGAPFFHAHLHLQLALTAKLTS